MNSGAAGRDPGGVFVREVSQPHHHRLRRRSPSPCRGRSVAFGSLSAALRAASTPPPRRFAARSPSPCRGGSGAARPQTPPCGRRQVVQSIQTGAVVDCSSFEVILFIVLRSGQHFLTPPKAAFEAGFAGRTSPARGGGPCPQGMVVGLTRADKHIVRPEAPAPKSRQSSGVIFHCGRRGRTPLPAALPSPS